MKKVRFALLTALLAVFALGASAQMQNPVHVSVQQKQVSPSEVDVIFSAKIDNGWHVYSTGLPSGGPISATVTTEKTEGAQAAGKLQAKGKEISNYDKLFEMKLRYFESAVTFVQRYTAHATTRTACHLRRWSLTLKATAQLTLPMRKRPKRLHNWQRRRPIR